MGSKKIADLAEQIKAQNAVIFEGAISAAGALERGGSKVLKIIAKQGIDNRGALKVVSAAKAKNVEVVVLSPEEMREFEERMDSSGLYSLGRSHGGIFAVAEKRTFLTPEELMRVLPKEQTYVSIAVIEGVEDPYNLGYAARAVYTQGTDALILPERDFGFSEATIEKASTGTFSKLPVAVFSKDKKDKSDKTALTNLLKGEGFTIYCIDKKAPANAKKAAAGIFGVKFAKRAVFVVGGEKRGISGEFLLEADEIVAIPYARPFSHSLAAQTAATIVAYEIHRQRAENKNI